MELLTWLGIVLCITQSGTFSGLNLALFGVSAMNLTAKARAGDKDAEQLLELRKDSNFLLTTILWGNVSSNVLLTLLSESVLAGVFGFVFSTFVITFGGEIIPQAYFSRNALRMATLLRPVLRFWQIALYPIAKPTALILDAWLGKESIEYGDEREVREMLKQYVASPTTDVSRVEGIGALNFLALDDLRVEEEGEPLHPDSVISLPIVDGVPQFPPFEISADDSFLQKVQASGQRWIVITTPENEPVLLLNSHALFRSIVFTNGAVAPIDFCHQPIVFDDSEASLGTALESFKVQREAEEDDVIDQDVVLVWTEKPRIITGADVLGRLMRGIAKPENPPT